MVNKVDRMTGFKSTKLARELFAKVGHPSQKKFKKLTNLNLIIKFPVTIENAVKVEKIYGPNITKIKGKNTWTKAEPVVTDNITVPREISRLTITSP